MGLPHYIIYLRSNNTPEALTFRIRVEKRPRAANIASSKFIPVFLSVVFMSEAKGLAAPELFTPACRGEVRDAIRRHGGVEVFFVAKGDENGVIAEIEAFAFGNAEAVPATLKQAQWGDVVVHNHPSGGLEPSSADINIAAELADLGVGSYIIDNDCAQVRVVVKAFKVDETQSVSFSEIADILGEAGPLARELPDFEDRPQQLEMARAVNEAFNNDEVAVIEAGTGVGKSLAYLVPALLWALKNRERVVISTNTINLQEQLMQKDLPAIKDYAELEFSAALVKGRGNYVSVRRTHHAAQESDLFDEADPKNELKEIVKWLEVTADGSRSDLAFEPAENVWERVQSQTDNCLRLRCPQYAHCHFFKSRRAASRAQVLVTNHHVLMADLAYRRETGDYSGAAILPPFKRVIIDEAHNLEEVATSYLGFQVSRRELKRLLQRLFTSGKTGRGALPALALRLSALELNEEGAAAVKPIKQAVWEELIPLCTELERGLEERLQFIYGRLTDYAESQGNGAKDANLELRVNAKVQASKFWREAVVPQLLDLQKQIGQLVRRLEYLLSNLKQLPDEVLEQLFAHGLDVKSLTLRLGAQADNLQSFIDAEADRCCWFSAKRLGGRKGAQRVGGDYRLAFCGAPLEIGEDLKQALFTKVKTCVMTSATLAVGGSFDYFKKRVGLAPLIPDESGEVTIERDETSERLSCVHLDTPFDFDRQALVAAPVDLPEPNQAAFADQLPELILKAVTISQGRAFILCTSYRLLDRLYEELRKPIDRLGYRCLKQGAEARHRLLNRFRSDKHSVLFATSSFWEGVDVKGESLSLLVLTRLPFRAPSEPVLEARVEHLEQHGLNAFKEFTVPQAVLRFKQGFGRLIRHKNDRGAVLVLDRRIVTKFYGRTFLESLPAKRVIQAGQEDILEELRTFFK